MAQLSGSCEERGAQPAGISRRYWVIKEDPEVSSVPRSRSLQSGRYIETAAGCEEGRSVFTPARFVEVDGEEPASLVGQEGVDADGCLPFEVISDGSVGQRPQGPGLERDLLPFVR